jgi:hypothetical protein
MADVKTVDEFLAMLKMIKPERNPVARTQRFVKLYRTADDTLDFSSLSEPEYDKVFSALSAACGFEDPLDALEALAQAGNVRSAA